MKPVCVCGVIPVCTFRIFSSIAVMHVHVRPTSWLRLLQDYNMSVCVPKCMLDCRSNLQLCDIVSEQNSQGVQPLLLAPSTVI